VNLKQPNTIVFFKRASFIAIIIGLRAVMLYFKWPNFLYETELFNANYFGLSYFTPSLGDFFANSLCLLLVVIVLYKWLIDNNIFVSNNLIISALLLFFSYLSLYIFQENILNVFKGSQYLMDFSLAISEAGISFKIAILGIFLFVSFFYILVQYFCIQQFSSQFSDRKHRLILLFSLVLISLLAWLLGIFPICILGGHIFFWIVVSIFDLSISIKNYQVTTTIFLVMASIVCSYLATYISYTQQSEVDYLQKQEFGKSKLENNDPIAEFLIAQASQNIKSSPKVLNFISQVSINFDSLDHEIIENNFSNWFDEYDISINYFDEFGKNLKNKYAKPMEEHWGLQLIDAQKTLAENTYFVENGQSFASKKYIHRLKLLSNIGKPFTLFFTLKSKKLLPSKTNNSLLATNTKNSYLLLGQNQLNNTIDKGRNIFEKTLLNDKKIFDKLLIINDVVYAAVKDQSGRIALVYSPKEGLMASFFSNFSFLFLLLFLLSVTIVLGYGFVQKKYVFNETFAAKIQLYFGLAFLAPLFLTLLLIFNSIRKTFVENQHQKFLNLSLSIKDKLESNNINLPINIKNKYFWYDEISKIENQYGIDLIVYDVAGQIVASTTGFQNYDAIQQQALSKTNRLQVENAQHIIISAGKIVKYFLPLTNYLGKKYGYIELLFFKENSLENAETRELFGSILAIFAFIILLFLLVSIFISNKLTSPLKLITKILHQTDFTKKNQKIEWKSNDEIGLLVNSYNNMLGNIEEGKTEIAQAEKQTAWKDIAKQVAHELKNPLTPMKLTLQHLQNNLAKGVELNKDTFDRSLSNLIYNIDNISEIVDSFMKFAKLPMPKNTKTDLIQPLKNVYELYKKSNQMNFEYDINIKKAYVLGDEKLLYQIINNLVINALQSIPDGEFPEIKLVLQKDFSNYLIKLADNGVGISEPLQKKIFLPNFSTKAEGMGIGLSLAKWGIENMNGKIWLESTPGVGTIFSIQLPVYQ
jgi:two-component system, NtrC family, nitrogen regulation sensor histidine kinase NtrY